METSDQTSNSVEVVGKVQKVTRSRISISSLHEVFAEEEDIKRWKDSLVEGNYVGIFIMGRRLVGVRNLGPNSAHPASMDLPSTPNNNLRANSPMQIALPSCAGWG